MPASTTLPERLAEAVAISRINEQLLRLQHLSNPVHTGKAYTRSRDERRDLFLLIATTAEKAGQQLSGYASVATRKRKPKPAVTPPPESPPATAAA